MQLADKGDLRGFAGFQLAAGKFPQSSHHFPHRPALNENSSVFIDQRHRHNRKKHQRIHVVGGFRHSLTLLDLSSGGKFRGGGDHLMLVRLMRKLIKAEKGGTAIEYGLIAALVVITMIAAFIGMANTTTDMWGNVNTKIETARTGG
ncbi:Flp family type IVb pilin [Sphingomonas oligophenolica]|uniref:Flp family type IVb pilin n=1 Tax=Sphingomonas oligophenolica TaxID=301154 RepID=A0ABU9Y1Y9_9SPHN